VYGVGHGAVRLGNGRLEQKVGVSQSGRPGGTQSTTAR
jgi:hypothetical protein